MNILKSLEKLLGRGSQPRNTQRIPGIPPGQLKNPNHDVLSMLKNMQPLPYAQYKQIMGQNGQPTGVYPGAPLGVGRGIPAQSADGYYPQDDNLGNGQPPLQTAYDTGAYYQPASYNTGGWPHVGLQNTGYPMGQNVLQGGSNAADPFGWNNNQGVIKRFKVQ